VPAYTSTTAYRKHVVEGKATSQRERILGLLLASDQPLSRADLVHYFTAAPFSDTWDHGPNIPLASVCGRLNVLIASKLARVAKIDRDPATGHAVEYVEAVRPMPTQKSFDGFMP
jgi:hypothetical protein